MSLRRRAMLDYAFRTALRSVGLFLPEFAQVAARFICDSGPFCYSFYVNDNVSDFAV